MGGWQILVNIIMNLLVSCFVDVLLTFQGLLSSELVSSVLTGFSCQIGL